MNTGVCAAGLWVVKANDSGWNEPCRELAVRQIATPNGELSHFFCHGHFNELAGSGHVPEVCVVPPRCASGTDIVGTTEPGSDWTVPCPAEPTEVMVVGRTPGATVVLWFCLAHVTELQNHAPGAVERIGDITA